MKKPIALIALLLLLALGGGVSASSASAQDAPINPVLKDCASSATGELTGTYTRKELTKALGDVDGDVSEYTNCYDAIRTALRDLNRRAAGNGGDGSGGNGTDDGSGGGGTGSSSGGPTGGGSSPGVGGAPADGTPIASAAPPAAVTPQPGSSAPVKLAGTTLTPSVPAALARDGHELPPALIGFLVLFGAGAAAIAATTIGRRVLARRRA